MSPKALFFKAISEQDGTEVSFTRQISENNSERL